MREKLLGIRRILVAKLCRGIFPVTNIGSTKGLLEASRHLAEGRGLALLYTHFSEGDLPRIFDFVMEEIPVARQVSILSPAALHQYKKFATRVTAALNGTELAPIVTKDTKSRWKEKGIPEQISEEKRQTIFRQYKERAADTLRQGGIVAISPQAGRRARLGDPPEGKPVWQILTAYEEKFGSQENVELLCVGLGLSGEQDYEKARGLNFGRLYTAKAGDLLSAEKMKDPGDGFVKIDETIFGILRTLVPEGYR